MPAARYWRINSIEPYNYEAGLVLSEVALYESETRVDNLASLSSTLAPISGSLGSLSDVDFGTTVTWAPSALFAPGFALIWDFGVGVTKDITAAGVAGPSRETFAHKFAVQYSSDGIVWLDAGRLPVGSYWESATDIFSYIFEANPLATVLLLNGNGVNNSVTVLDSSLVAKTVTVFGNAKISTVQSKYGGASLYFDGLNDYLSVPDSEDFNFGSGNWTIEFWGYGLDNGEASNGIVVGQANGLGADVASWAINLDGANIGINASTGTSTWNVVALSAVGVNPNAAVWKHYAFVRSGNVLTIYVDGVAINSGAITAAMPNSTLPLTIGRGSGTGNSLLGYVDDLRITKGVARYTTAFTPPASELTASSLNYEPFAQQVSLLLNANGTDSSTAISDGSLNPKSISLFGGAQLKTAIKKFGTASLFLDGDAYLETPSNSAFSFNGDFTCEAWIYPTSISGVNVGIIFARQETTAVSGNTAVFQFRLTTAAKLEVAFRQSGLATIIGIVGNITIATNTWTHVAVTRQGSTVRMFVNGVLDVSGTSSLDVSPIEARPFQVGALQLSAAANSFFTGYMDDIRITRGVARYTASFTPPAAELFLLLSDPTPLRGNKEPVPAIVSEYPVGTTQSSDVIVPQLAFDQEDGGGFEIVGTVKEVALPVNTPLARRVRLYEERSGRFIKGTFSDADGNYAFSEIRGDRPYTVVAFDHTDTYRAVVADKLIAEPMS